METDKVIEAAEKRGFINKSQSELLELLHKEEALCDELKPYVFKSTVGGNMISHPLVIELFYDPKRCALLNYRLQAKKEMLKRYKAAGNWHGYIYAHERPYRIQALCDVQRRGVTDPKLITSVWIDSENLWQHRTLWKLIWASMPDPHAVMDTNEKTVYDMMPNKVELHRGIRHKRHNRRGMSWTRDKERASWFANRYKGQKGLEPVVLSCVVPKKNILAFFNGRGEEECVIMPHKLPRKITEFKIG